MTPQIETIGDCAVQRLRKLLADVEAETNQILAQDDLPSLLAHFHSFRELVRLLEECWDDLNSHVSLVSQELLPTLFANHGVKTISVKDVGRATVNYRWTASMNDKNAGFDWLRSTGNEGLIIETVNAMTFGAFAKTRAAEGKPLPDNLFKVSTAPYTSITKIADDDA